LINPIVNPADILPVNGIPKLVIVNEAVAAAAWPSILLPSLILGICIINAFESIAIAIGDKLIQLEIIQLLQPAV
jgi:hypothetical protein